MMNYNDSLSIMNNKGVSEEELLLIRNLLEESSKEYYNTNTLILSNKEYDILARLYREKTGIVIVGAESPKGKRVVNVDHTYNELVGTLDKANNLKDVKEWLEKIYTRPNYIGRDINLCITLKFDGNSVVIEYNKGKVVKALTRGENGKGMDLTHVFKDHKINYKGKVGVKYEVIITYDNYEKLITDTGLTYVNPRTLVSGKLGDDNAYDYYKYMTLVPLWVKTDNKELNKFEQFDFIEDNFTTNYLFEDVTIINDYSDIQEVLGYIEETYNRCIDSRESLPFMIDGLVIEITDNDIKSDLGFVKGEPRWAKALKFPYMEDTTEVTGMDFCLGDSGVITPRVWFKPIKFNGTTHKKQSLSDYSRFKSLNLGVGSKVLIEYRNDVLSYVNKLGEDPSIVPIEFTKECPVCKGPVIINERETFAYCDNPKCEGKLAGKINNYLTKMDIKGIKIATIKKIVEAGLLNKIEDLYTLDYNEFKNIDGLGEITAKNMKTALSNKIPYDYEILGSMGIPNISLTSSKILCENFTLSELIEMVDNHGLKDDNVDSEVLYMNVIGLEGFSDVMANLLKDGLINNLDTLNFLLKNIKYINYREKLKETKKEGIEKMNIVFTGFRDKDLQVKLELLGHKVSTSVSSRTKLVVASNPLEESSKLKKARDLNIKIVSLEEFKEKYK